MGLEDLPEGMINRIVTCSASDYMNHYSLNPENFDLRGFAHEVRSNEVWENMLFLASSARKGAAEKLEKMRAAALSDTRISEATLANTPGNTDKQKIVIYGTAIVPKASKKSGKE